MMQRPARYNAGVAAPHFSQDESLYAGAQKRQRFVLEPCQRCGTVHRSDKKRERCENAHAAEQRKAQKASEAAADAHAAEQRKAQKASEAAAAKARRDSERLALQCSHCGGTHK